MPPVAANILRSASMPIFRTAGKISAGGIPFIPPAVPSSAKSMKLSERLAALFMNVKKSMSLCAPEFLRSTSPGFGVTDTSTSIASSASLPISLLVIVLVFFFFPLVVFPAPQARPEESNPPNAFICRRYREHCKHSARNQSSNRNNCYRPLHL